MNEGDLSVVFSQYGEIVDILLVCIFTHKFPTTKKLRDKDTGDSKGKVFLAYEDQRSTDLAVDN